MSNDPAVEPGRTQAVPAVELAPAAGAGAWRVPAIATAAVFTLNATIIASWVARLPATRDRLELDPRTIGLVLLMMGIGSLSAMPFVGRLAARWSSRPVLLTAAAVSAVCLVSLSLTPNAVATGAVLFVLGAAYGSWDVSMNIHGSYVDRSSGRDYMPRYHGSWSVGLAVGAALGALAAGIGLSLTAHFAIAAVVGCGGSILIALRFFRDDRGTAGADDEVASDDESVEADGPKPRLLSRRLVLIGVITLCGCLLEGAAADWVALYLTDERGATAALAALAYGVWAAAMALSRFSGTTLIERLGRARAIRLAGAVVLVGVVATLAVPGVYGAMVGVVFWGAGVALVFPAAMSAGGETPGRAADGIATVSTIGYGGFLVGPPLIGLIAHEIGLGRALWILPVLCVGILLLAPVVAPPAPEPDPAS
ncbi:MAG: MFS transporter [Candidatus Nanopelagicales bacterium]